LQQQAIGCGWIYNTGSMLDDNFKSMSQVLILQVTTATLILQTVV